MKYGFVYIWRDRKHNRYYIGSHWGTEDDGYTTGQAWSRNAIKRRPQDFRRRILEKNIPRDKLIWNERCWLWFVSPDELGKRYYNWNREPMKHWSHEENKKTTIEKLSEISKNLHNDPKYRKKYEKGLKKRVTTNWKDPKARGEKIGRTKRMRHQERPQPRSGGRFTTWAQ